MTFSNTHVQVLVWNTFMYATPIPGCKDPIPGYVTVTYTGMLHISSRPAPWFPFLDPMSSNRTYLAIVQGIQTH